MRILVIDGNSIVNRAFYGIKALTNKHGIFTNALFGFMNIYLKEFSLLEPHAVVVAFDRKAPTFRHKAVASYKANRKGMPEELAVQLPYLQQILIAMGIRCLSIEGYEADDILGTLACAAKKQGHDCFLLTGDRDSLQLIDSYTTVRLATNRDTIHYTLEQFQADYGFAPPSLVDLKALMGDSSDNITGVKGIGEKTASILIKKWGSIERIYDNIDALNVTPHIRQKLIEGKEDAFQSKWLAQIVTDVPIDQTIEAYTLQPIQDETLRRLLTELELNKLLSRLGLKPLTPEPSLQEPISLENVPILTVTPLAEAKDLLEGYAKPIPFTLREGVLSICIENHILQSQDEDEILSFLASSCHKLCDNAKPVYHYCLARSTALQGIRFDAQLCGYLLNPSAKEYSVATVCASVGVPHYDSLGEYADVQALPMLAKQGIEELTQQGMLELWNRVELPLTRVLSHMEHVGIAVQREGILHFGMELNQRIEELQETIYRHAGREFNISSPKQLGVILFEDLELPCKKKTKTGYSTNAEVLQDLSHVHPIIECIQEYRQYTKLRSTYVEGLLATIAEDERIHTTYQQTETRTGRISSIEPNLQNIPIRTELGANIRKFFCASEGCVLLDADYSQIELRLMAHLSGDTAMQEDFLSGADIHTRAAAKVFAMPEEFITPTMRSAAKAVNFGILYGMGAYSLSQDIHVTVSQAKQYIEEYLGSYPKVSSYLDDIVANATRDGYVTTMLGRRRSIPELSAKNKMVQAMGKRVAMNTPIQGSAADLIKLAMIHVHDRLEREVPSARLLLQVHDELIVEAPFADADRAAVVLQEEMEQVATLAVPLTAEVGRGDTWYAAKD